MKTIRILLSACLLILSPSILQAQEMVAHWSLDTLINDKFIDHVTDDFAGTAYGAQIVPGKVNNALEFNGTSHYARVPGDGQAPPEDFSKLSVGSISLWFRVDDIPMEYGIRPIFYYGREDACNFIDAANEGMIIEVGHSPIHNQSRRLYFTTWKNGCTFPTFCYDSWNPIEVGEWYHYVAVVGSDFNTGYLNGQVMDDRVYNFGNIFSHEFFSDARAHENLWIGRGYWDSNDMYFDGAIDEIKIFNYPLSPAEVDTLYQEGFPVIITDVPASDEIQFEVFPNPAQNEIRVRLDNRDGRSLTFNLYNSSGKLMLQQTIEDLSRERSVDISSLPEGLYFYAITENSKIIATHKLVKM